VNLFKLEIVMRLVGALCLLFSAAAFADATTPFERKTLEYVLPVTTSSATAKRILPITDGEVFTQYRIVIKGTAMETVTIACGPSSASVTPVVAPTDGTPKNTYTFLIGTDEIITCGKNAWFNTIGSADATVYISGGIGL
jgi:hypothetical protein